MLQLGKCDTYRTHSYSLLELKYQPNDYDKIGGKLIKITHENLP